MIDIARLLRHLAWADSKMFDDLMAMPPEALEARYATDAWPVAQLAVHIVGGAEWYRYCLTGVTWTDLAPPQGRDDLAALQAHLAEIDALLLAEAAAPDGEVTFTDEQGEASAQRSTILSQAVLHSIEHRAQIASALEAAGFTGMRLDDYDLWAFEALDA